MNLRLSVGSQFKALNLRLFRSAPQVFLQMPRLKRLYVFLMVIADKRWVQKHALSLKILAQNWHCHLCPYSVGQMKLHSQT